MTKDPHLQKPDIGCRDFEVEAIRDDLEGVFYMADADVA